MATSVKPSVSISDDASAGAPATALHGVTTATGSQQQQQQQQHGQAPPPRATPAVPSAPLGQCTSPAAASDRLAPSTASSSSSSNSSTHSGSSSEDESSENSSPFMSLSSSSSSASSSSSSRAPPSGSPATLFVPSASPASFGASAPVAAALAASLGVGPGVSFHVGSSSAAAAAAAAYMASPTGHLLSRSVNSKLHTKKKKANVRYKDHCDNCLTDQTPQWRKGRRGETFCQDCGRSERRHDYARLKREREKAIEKTLIDLLENSVYVPRWGQSSSSSSSSSSNAKPGTAAHVGSAVPASPPDRKDEVDDNADDDSEIGDDEKGPLLDKPHDLDEASAPLSRADERGEEGEPVLDQMDEEVVRADDVTEGDDRATEPGDARAGEQEEHDGEGSGDADALGTPASDRAAGGGEDHRSAAAEARSTVVGKRKSAEETASEQQQQELAAQAAKQTEPHTIGMQEEDSEEGHLMMDLHDGSAKRRKQATTLSPATGSPSRPAKRRSENRTSAPGVGSGLSSDAPVDGSHNAAATPSRPEEYEGSSSSNNNSGRGDDHASKSQEEKADEAAPTDTALQAAVALDLPGGVSSE